MQRNTPLKSLHSAFPLQNKNDKMVWHSFLWSKSGNLEAGAYYSCVIKLI